MNLILATRNPSKREQVQVSFAGSRYSILSLDDIGVKGEAIEDGKSLEENAAKKAWFVHDQQPHLWTMADDTGLFIKGLGGEPGIYPARWAGEGAETSKITDYCLKRMGGLLDRSATFKAVVVVVSPSGEQYAFEGEVQGSMLKAPRVPPQSKMPYSALFVPIGDTRSWAEMSTEEENAVSHRGETFRKVRTFLDQQ